MTDEARYTVIYDGDCDVCARSVEVLRGMDRRGLLELVPSQAEGVAERFPWIDPEAYDRSLQLVGPGGGTWEGAEALERLVGILPRVRWTGVLFRIPFARTLVDRAYRAFARNRRRLGCTRHCAVPAPGDDTATA